jgi:ribosomal protein S18 acetylase RimI-like enzyme
MKISKTSRGDAEVILEIQKLAFRSEAEIYNDFSLPPLLETLDHIRTELETKTILKAVTQGELVGAIRAWEQDGTCHIERLFVRPGLQGKGIGTSLLQAVEKAFSKTTRFELFTGHRSERNIRLYSRLGYQVFKQERVNDKLSFVFMEKWK